MDIGPKRDVLGELKAALESRQPGVDVIKLFSSSLYTHTCVLCVRVCVCTANINIFTAGKAQLV
jgi:hypothetical protein